MTDGQADAEEPQSPLCSHVNNWLFRHNSGCAFAALLAGNERALVDAGEDEQPRSGKTPGRGLINWISHDEGAAGLDPEALSQSVGVATRQGRLAGIVFPQRCDALGIGGILATLSADKERWRVRACATGHETGSARSFAVHIRTEAGLWASVGGFAPLGTMPVTRRSPVTAIVVWAGAKNPNSRIKKPKVDPPIVELTDAPRDFKEQTFLNMKMTTWRNSRPLLSLRVPADHKRLNDPDFERVAPLFEMTFCLPAEACAGLEALDDDR